MTDAPKFAICIQCNRIASVAKGLLWHSRFLCAECVAKGGVAR